MTSFVPNTFELYRETDLEPLKKHLMIDSPGQEGRSPILFTVDRSREVTLDWDKLLRLDNDKSSNIDYVRFYLESSVALRDDSGALKYKATIVAGSIKQCKDFGGNLVAPREFDNNLWKTETVGDEEWLFEHASGRLYRLRSDQSISHAEWETENDYEKTWVEKITGIEFVCLPADATWSDKNGALPAREVLDLSPPAIVKQYKELKIRRVFESKVSESAEKLVEALAQTDPTNAESIDALTKNYVALKSRVSRVEEAMQRLADKASDLGYYLQIMADGTVVPPTGPAIPVPEGVLYRRVKRYFYWTVQHERIEHVKIGPHTVKIPKKELRIHTATMTVPEPVKIDFDPWVEKEEELLKTFSNVYRFVRTDIGLFTTDGVSLEEIMRSCDLSESFRRVTALMIPVYEQSLIEGETLVRYEIITKPFKGFMPVALPAVFLQETVSYRSRWIKSELGPLLSSINLAPGEDRKITVVKRFEYKTDSKRTATSILDLTETRSIELGSEMEAEARNEQEKSNSSNWNASVSGSFKGIFGGSAGGGRTFNQSSKQFARNLHKLAQKAASSISRKTKQEVSSSFSLQTSVENAETTEIKVKNINEGRTLNLIFFQVNNRYSGGVYLDDLRITISDSTEVVAGTGITLTKTFQLGDLVSSFRYLQSQQLPLGGKNDKPFRDSVIKELFRTLKQEYLKEATANENSANVLAAEITEPVDSSEENLKKMATALRNATIVDEPIDREELVVPSNATFLDTLIGLLPGTEPYSEEMRKQEIRMRAAQVYKEAASAYFEESKGKALLNMPATNIPITPIDEPENTIISTSVASDEKRLEIVLAKPLQVGDWSVQYNGEEKAKISKDQTGRKKILLLFEAKQPWLTSELPFRVRLLDRISQESIIFTGH